MIIFRMKPLYPCCSTNDDDSYYDVYGDYYYDASFVSRIVDFIFCFVLPRLFPKLPFVVLFFALDHASILKNIQLLRSSRVIYGRLCGWRKVIMIVV